MARVLFRSAAVLVCGVVAAACGNDNLRSTAPSIQLTQSALDFGPVEELTQKSLGITVENRGLAPLHVTPKMAPLSSSEFEVGQAPSEIAPGASATVTVTYRPVGAGSDTGTLLVDSDDPDSAEVEIALTGGPIAPKLSAAPDPVDFAPAAAGRNTKTLTLKNDGLATLTLQAMTLTGNGDFSVEPPGLPRSLLPHEELAVTVIYQRSARTGDGTLEIDSDDPAGKRTVRLVPDPGSIDPNACARAPSTAADQYESNDSRSSPNPTVSSTASNTNVYSYDVTLPAGDQDWFQFDIPSSGSHTTAKAEILCLNWAGTGCGAPATVGLELYYKDLVGEQHDGSSDGKSGLAMVQNSGDISFIPASQRWIIGVLPTSDCAGDVINATVQITVTNN